MKKFLFLLCVGCLARSFPAVSQTRYVISEQQARRAVENAERLRARTAQLATCRELVTAAEQRQRATEAIVETQAAQLVTANRTADVFRDQAQRRALEAGAAQVSVRRRGRQRNVLAIVATALSAGLYLSLTH